MCLVSQLKLFYIKNKLAIVELRKILNPDEQTEVINRILKTLVSEDEFQDLMDGLSLCLEEGSSFYCLRDEDAELGFIIATPLIGSNGTTVDLISIDEIWIKSDSTNEMIADAISSGIRKLKTEFKAKRIEVVISRDNAWISKSLQDNNMMCSEIKLEKVLPTANNLGDVLELIKDCTPIDRIVQVLLEKEDELRAELIEEVDEIDELLNDGWIPVIVIVTFEPDGLQISEILESSNQLINWDDYSLVYRS